MISVGIFICTYFSSPDLGAEEDLDSTAKADVFWWIVGVLLLVVA